MHRRILLPLILAVGLLGATELGAQDRLCGDCRFHVADQVLLAGATGQEVPLLITNDVVLYGLSIAVQIDAALLRITGVRREGTATAAADFFEGGFDAGLGRAGYGVVFDLGGDFSDKNLAPGAGRAMLILTVDVLASSDLATTVAFKEVLVPGISQQAIKNVMTNQDGKTIAPALQNGQITIETRKPEIAGIQPAAGLAGDAIRISGRFFGESGLAVKVCNTAAAFVLVDAQTVDVTAPACATVGCVAVEVCTTRGCDSEAQGFCYNEPPPVITGFEGNSGPAGTQFTIVGEHFDRPGLAVRVCSQPAAHQPPTNGGTRVLVTAPECAILDCVAVEVSTAGGADADARGYCYSGEPPVIAGFEGNSGPAGTQFTIVGDNFDFSGLSVRVCGQAAAHQAPTGGGTRLVVTAPGCGGPSGPVAVEVCTDFGCDDDPAGFDFAAGIAFLRGDANDDARVDLSDGVAVFGDLFLGNPARAPCRDALDANDSGGIDISDGIFVLNFLFQGGRDIPPPFPDAGLDPTDDALPPCAGA
jgi:hypothetical protein